MSIDGVDRGFATGMDVGFGNKARLKPANDTWDKYRGPEALDCERI
jgi:hypothetical protein